MVRSIRDRMRSCFARSDAACAGRRHDTFYHSTRCTAPSPKEPRCRPTFSPACWEPPRSRWRPWHPRRLRPPARATAVSGSTSAGGSVILADQAEQQVRAILDDAARDPAAVGPGAQQFGDLYASFMDEAAIERAGTAPLKPYFAKIDAANDPHKLQVLFSTGEA